MSMSAFLPPVHEPPYAMSIFTSPLLARRARAAARRCADRPGVATIGSTRGEIDVERRAVRRARDRPSRCARARRRRSRPRCFDEVVDDDLVGLDDAGEAAGLDRHVGERRALVERPCARCPSPANSSTLPMPSPLLKNGWRQDVEHHVLRADARRAARPCRTKRAVSGTVTRTSLRVPGVRHVGRADAEREAAERAGHAGVRVGAGDELTGERDLLDDLVVADGLRARRACRRDAPRRRA